MLLSAAYACLFYAATAVLVAGLAARIWDYWRTPAPLVIPTTPAPRTRAGVALRMLREVALFESLFRANKWIWLFGWIFHLALALVLVRHLRYFTEPVWLVVEIAQPFGIYAYGVLLEFDLPDVAGAVGPRPVLLLNPSGPNGEPAGNAAQDLYRGAPHVKVRTAEPGADLVEILKASST